MRRGLSSIARMSTPTTIRMADQTRTTWAFQRVLPAQRYQAGQCTTTGLAWTATAMTSTMTMTLAPARATARMRASGRLSRRICVPLPLPDSRRRGDIGGQVRDDDVDLIDIQPGQFPYPVTDVATDLPGDVGNGCGPADADPQHAGRRSSSVGFSAEAWAAILDPTPSAMLIVPSSLRPARAAGSTSVPALIRCGRATAIRPRPGHRRGSSRSRSRSRRTAQQSACRRNCRNQGQAEDQAGDDSKRGAVHLTHIRKRKGRESRITVAGHAPRDCRAPTSPY